MIIPDIPAAGKAPPIFDNIEKYYYISPNIEMSL